MEASEKEVRVRVVSEEREWGREERDARDATLESQRVFCCSLAATLLVSLRDVEGESRSEQEDASSRELGSGHEERRQRRRAPRGSEGGEIERLDLGRRDRAKEG